MASSVPFIRGQNSVLKVYQDGKPVYLACKTWDIDENAAEIADGVNGEYRDRLDLVVNYFSISTDIFQSDQAVMDMIIAAQEVDDAAGLPLKQIAAIQLQQRDGTRAAYLLQECKFGPFKTTNSSRSDAYMINLKIRARFMKRVPTI